LLKLAYSKNKGSKRERKNTKIQNEKEQKCDLVGNMPGKIIFYLKKNSGGPSFGVDPVHNWRNQSYKDGVFHRIFKNRFKWRLGYYVGFVLKNLQNSQLLGLPEFDISIYPRTQPSWAV